MPNNTVNKQTIQQKVSDTKCVRAPVRAGVKYVYTHAETCIIFK